jgi:hypothetical protein
VCMAAPQWPVLLQRLQRLTLRARDVERLNVNF